MLIRIRDPEIFLTLDLGSGMEKLGSQIRNTGGEGSGFADRDPAL
jgi:hypothetical protein